MSYIPTKLRFNTQLWEEEMNSFANAKHINKLLKSEWQSYIITKNL